MLSPISERRDYKKGGVISGNDRTVNMMICDMTLASQSKIENQVLNPVEGFYDYN